MDSFEKITVIAPGVAYRWNENIAPPSADSFLLADFARERVRGRVCDLCGGGGLISLLLLSKGFSGEIVCADADVTALELARKNSLEEGLCFETVRTDVNLWRESLSPESFDSVVCNPPYHEQGGKISAKRSMARSEAGCSLEAVCLAAGGILKNGGRLFVCMKASRTAELIVAMKKSGTEPKRLRFVAHAEGHEPYLVLCEGIKGASPSVSVAPELHMYCPDGRPSEESKRIYYGIGD